MAHRTNALRRLSIRLVVMCVVIASVIVGGVWWAMATVNNSQLASRYQTLMALNRLGGTQAPNFTLTDQNGNQVSLSSFRGQNVVLSFIDPKCTDICPIVSQEFIRADKTLGDTSKSTVFLGVNVNQYHESTADVLAFSRSEGLQKLPNWHFLTGSTAALKHVWKAYGIAVKPNPTGDVEHSSFLYFIDPQGREQFIANPDNVKSTITEWGDGIAYFVKRLG